MQERRPTDAFRHHRVDELVLGEIARGGRSGHVEEASRAEGEAKCVIVFLEVEEAPTGHRRRELPVLQAQRPE